LSAIDRAIRDLFKDVTLERSDMHGYQNTALEFLKANPFSGLFIDMGLGKTVSCGTLIVDLLNDFEITDGKKVLIVGPKKVALTTWPDEFRTWRHLAPFEPNVIHVEDDDKRLKEKWKQVRADAMIEAEAMRYVGQEKSKYADKAAQQACAALKIKLREEGATNKRQIHVISRDWLEWLVDFYGSKWPYEIVIIDESSGFKDHKSGRFEALKSVRTQPSEPIKRLHILTATPATEGYEGLFSQIFLLDKGDRLGRKITHYREKYFKECPYTHKLKLLPGAEKSILARISDICLVMKREDYLPSVPPVYVNRYVDMDDEQMRKYLTMEKDMVLKLDDGTVVKAENAAALSQKLLQMASGVLYDVQLRPGQTEDDDHVKVLKVHSIHDHKIEMLKQIVEEAQGQPILIAYHHKSSKDRLKKAFPQLKIMDKDGKLKKPWNAGKIPMLAMHPASGGHGLNLQQGGHIIVFFDIIWSLELYQQFIGRLDRQGQKNRVTVIHIVCRNTMDQTVVDVLKAKDDVQEKLFKILKKMRRKLLALLKKMKAQPKTQEEWEEVREVLTDYADKEADEERFDEPTEHCPKCGDIGGPCGPGSDCYDEL
jgi:SNF2 family DNA or RNA helicase